MKNILVAILLCYSVTLFAQKTWVAGGGTGSGNWSNGANWSGGTVPTATTDVDLTSINGGAVITIDANAVCRRLFLFGQGGLSPLLRFAPTGTVSLTITGDLLIQGGPGGYPKLHSNGNPNATLILRSASGGATYQTTISNDVADNSAGLNMNEGNVIIDGPNSSLLSVSKGLRLGNLQIGDGVSATTLNYYPVADVTLSVSRLVVKSNASLLLGGSNSTPCNIGSNNIPGVTNWTNGLTIEYGGTLSVQSAYSANLGYFNILGGDVWNIGTLSLSGTNRKINVRLANATGMARTRTIDGWCVFNGLTIDDTLGTINLAGYGVTVLDSITLNRGVIVAPSGLLTFDKNCIVLNGSNLSYVQGEVENKWDLMSTVAAKKFPLGYNSIYRPLVITHTPVSTLPTCKAALYNSNPSGTFSGGIVSEKFYYMVTPIGWFTATGTAQINFDPVVDGVSNPATLGVGQATTASGVYTNLGNGSNTATSVTSTSFTAANGNYFALVSTGGNSLPVEWKSLSAIKTNGGNVLNWSTASESNNSHFEVQRSLDGRSFETIGRVEGQGNTTRESNYSYIDADTRITSSKTIYYLLKQVDADGQSSFSKVVSVVAERKNGLEASLPNPFNDKLTVTVNAAGVSTASVTLIDMVGKVYFTSTEQLIAGANTVIIETIDIPNGIYFVRVEANGHTFNQKVVKK